jgi:hypothetical protein
MKHLNGSASNKSLGSSGIMAEYRLDDRDSIATRSKAFLLPPLCPDQLWAHPASYPMGTDLFHGSKAWPGLYPDHSPHLVPSSRMSRSYTTSPPCRLHGDSETDLLHYARIFLTVSRNKTATTKYTYWRMLNVLFAVTNRLCALVPM